MVLFAYEDGIDVRHALRHHSGILESDIGSYSNTPALKIFELLSGAAFDNVEYFEAEDLSLDKMFWYNQFKKEANSSRDSMHLFVISDEFIHFKQERTVGDHRDWGATLYPTKNGVVIAFDEDYGDCDWTDIFHVLLQDKQMNRAKRERTNHEMAV